VANLRSESSERRREAEERRANGEALLEQYAGKAGGPMANASELLRADWDAFGEVSTSLPAAAVDRLLIARGWTLPAPGRRGLDQLVGPTGERVWEVDEALRLALVAEALAPAPEPVDESAAKEDRRNAPPVIQRSTAVGGVEVYSVEGLHVAEVRPGPAQRAPRAGWDVVLYLGPEAGERDVIRGVTEAQARSLALEHAETF
jgi:hypothetical protein